MLQERNQSSGNTHNLVGSNVHKVDIFVVVYSKLVVETARITTNKFVVFIHRGIGLGDDIFIFSIS